jgi:hypothetical protein
MASVGRTAAVILILAALAAAVQFAPGTRFGMVGLDYRTSSGRIYSYPHDSGFSSVDPVFRAGICVTRSLALGADLALLKTFPRHGDMFLNTPVFAFGPTATWFHSEISGIQPYGMVGTGVSYGFPLLHQGWRFRLGAGALLEAGPVTFGTEIGWYADWIRTLGTTGPPWRVEPIWVSGSSMYLGLRLSDLRL